MYLVSFKIPQKNIVISLYRFPCFLQKNLILIVIVIFNQF